MLKTPEKSVTLKVTIETPSVRPEESPIMRAIGYLMHHIEKSVTQREPSYLDVLDHPSLLVSYTPILQTTPIQNTSPPIHYYGPSSVFSICIYSYDRSEQKISHHYDEWLVDNGFLPRDTMTSLGHCYLVMDISFQMRPSDGKFLVEFQSHPYADNEIVNTINVDTSGKVIGIGGPDDRTDFGESLKKYMGGISPEVDEVVSMFIDLMNRTDT